MPPEGSSTDDLITIKGGEVWNCPERINAVHELYSGKVAAKNFVCCRCEESLGAGGIVQSLIHESWQKIRRWQDGKKSDNDAGVNSKAYVAGKA